MTMLTDEFLIKASEYIRSTKELMAPQSYGPTESLEEGDYDMLATIIVNLDASAIQHIDSTALSMEKYFDLAMRAIEKKPRLFSKIADNLLPDLRYKLAVRAVELGLDDIAGFDFTRTKFVELALKVVANHGNLLEDVPADLMSDDKYEKFVEAVNADDLAAFKAKREYARYMRDCRRYQRSVVHQDMSRAERCQMAITAIKSDPKLLRGLIDTTFTDEEVLQITRALVEHDGNNLAHALYGHDILIKNRAGVRLAESVPIGDGAYEELVCLALANGLTNLAAIDFTYFDVNAHKDAVLDVLRQCGGILSPIKGIRDEDYYAFALAASNHTRADDIDWNRLSKKQTMEVLGNILSRDPNALKHFDGELSDDEIKQLLRHATIGAIPKGIFTREEYDKLAIDWASRDTTDMIDISQLDTEQCSPETYIEIAWKALEQSPEVLWTMHLPFIGDKTYSDMVGRALYKHRDAATALYVRYPPCRTAVYRRLLREFL